MPVPVRVLRILLRVPQYSNSLTVISLAIDVAKVRLHQPRRRTNDEVFALHRCPGDCDMKWILRLGLRRLLLCLTTRIKVIQEARTF